MVKYDVVKLQILRSASRYQHSVMLHTRENNMKKRVLLTGLIAAFIMAIATPVFAQGINLLGEESTEAEDNDHYGMNLIPANDLANGKQINVAQDGENIFLSKDANGNFKNDGLFQSNVIKTEQPFNALIFSHNSQMPPGTILIFFVRTLIDGVAGPWKVVALESEAMFAQSANSYQYQVRLGTDNTDVTPQVKGVHVGFANVDPNVQQSFDNSNYTPDGNAQFTGPSSIIERNEWGARAPASGYSNHSINTIIVHNTASPSSSFRGAQSIKNIQNYHMNTKHWKDIAYHFIIGPDGSVYRGRPETALGSHCIPNTGKIGVSVFGNFDNERISPQAKASLISVIGYLRQKYGVGGSNVRAHRDFASTSCPGNNLFPMMGEFQGRN